ncbi:MAG: exonuclease domain-containing protein [Planctomycetota bacterium]|jgi:DNA polymerase-3 subunit epsilon
MWVAFDTETTGLEPGVRLIELAAVAFDRGGRIHDSFSRLVNPGQPLPADIQALTGLCDDDLATADSAPVVIEAWLNWLPSGAIVAAHNAAFDINVLACERDRASQALPALRVVDTLAFARALAQTDDHATDHSLQAQVRHYGWDISGPAHRALPDAEATRLLVEEARTRLSASRFAAIAQGRRARAVWRHGHDLPAAFADLPTAIAEQRPLRIRYTSRSGEVSEREVLPYGYAHSRRGLHFHGHCRLRNERRCFAVARSEILAP